MACAAPRSGYARRQTPDRRSEGPQRGSLAPGTTLYHRAARDDFRVDDGIGRVTDDHEHAFTVTTAKFMLGDLDNIRRAADDHWWRSGACAAHKLEHPGDPTHRLGWDGEAGWLMVWRRDGAREAFGISGLSTLLLLNIRRIGVVQVPRRLKRPVPAMDACRRIWTCRTHGSPGREDLGDRAARRGGAKWIARRHQLHQRASRPSRHPEKVRRPRERAAQPWLCPLSWWPPESRS